MCPADVSRSDHDEDLGKAHARLYQDVTEMKPNTANLFVEPTVRRERSLGYSEPAVHWLAESTWDAAIEARKWINSWYRRFPDSEGHLGFRLKSERDEEHHAALDELLVHELLQTVHDDVRYEEGGRGPDFRVYHEGRLTLAVEVLTLFQKAEWESEWRGYGRIADAVNKRVRVRGFFLQIDPKRLERHPSERRLARFLDQFVDGLPSPTETEAYVPDRDLPRITYREEGVEIGVRAIPMRRDAKSLRDPNTRVVGAGPVIGGMVDSAIRLKKALRGKRPTRYDLPSLPYIVVVVNRDPFCSEDQYMQAAYGPDQIATKPAEAFATSLPLQVRGFFAETRDRNTRLSGIAIVNGFAPWDPLQTRVLLLCNPYARLPIPEGSIPYSHKYDFAEPDWAWNPPLGSPNELALAP
jgi:hypothetical protein